MNNASEKTEPVVDQKVDEATDWEPGPECREGILSLLRDARAGHRTIVSLFSPDEQRELLAGIDDRDRPG